MKIIEDYKNPIRSRYVERYNNLSEEVQNQWDKIESLPKEELNIRPIKRNRKPELSPGTIFAIHLPEDKYLYGKILADNLSLPKIDKNFFVAFISKIVSNELIATPFELTESNIMFGPIIIGDGLWKNGTFYSICQENLTERERNIPFGFYASKLMFTETGKMEERGSFIDVLGESLDKEPKFLGNCGYITIHGIEKAIKQEVLSDPDLLKCD